VERETRREVLEEVARLLESVRLEPGGVGEVSFEDAQADSRVATALSAVRAASSALSREPAANEEIRGIRKLTNP
jgi:septal ring factor EnvC (AmiA/AmiB activator)